MNIDFTPFFKKYEALSEKAESAFANIAKAYPESVRCKVGCSDCCYALFDLTLIEALYINHHFHQAFTGAEREAIIEKANHADRQVFKLKRKAYKDLESGKKDEAQIFAEMSQERLRCPLLNQADQCDLYAHRPITCRLYGIPTYIGGKAHTCGISGFTEGKSYPTADLDMIYDALYNISQELVTAIQSQYAKLPELLVPLSMSLLTVYDEEYLGIPGEKKVSTAKGESND